MLIELHKDRKDPRYPRRMVTREVVKEFQTIFRPTDPNYLHLVLNQLGPVLGQINSPTKSWPYLP